MISTQLLTRYIWMRRIESGLVIIAWCLCYMPFVVLASIILGVVILFPIMLVGVAISKEGGITTEEIFIGCVIMAVYLLILLMTLTPTFHVLLRIRKNFRSARDLSNLETLPTKYAEMFVDRMKFLITRFNGIYKSSYEPSTIQVYYEKNNHKATPAMIVTSGVMNLILPAGFLKVFKADAECADAMLAHEYAHFLHDDSKLLLAVRCYLKASLVLFFYWILSFVLFITFSMQQWSEIDIRKAEIETSISKHSGNPFLSEYLAQSEEKLMSTENEQMMVLLNIGLFSSKFFLFVGLLMFLRRRVHRSEDLADLVAVFITSPLAVRGYLEKYIGWDDGTLRLHPTTEHRIKKIDDYERIINKHNSRMRAA